MVEKDGYLRFTKNVRELKTAKEALREEGYPLAKVRELVSSIIRPVRFPPGAILLPAPSTTGTNIIPRVIAAELGRAQGIEVVVGVIATRNIVKTANKSGLGKLRDPIRLDVVGDLEKLKGKRVYVVDDVVTTGDLSTGQTTSKGRSMTAPDPKLDSISSLKPGELENLTPEQDSTLETLRQWLHDFNLGKAPAPEWDSNTRALVSRYSELKMDREVREMGCSTVS